MGRAGTNQLAPHSYLCAVLTSVSGLVHLGLIHEHHHWWTSIILFAMAAACLACIPHICPRPTKVALRRLMFMALGMVALHASLLLAGGDSSQHHEYGAAAMSPAQSAAQSSSLTMIAVIGLELLTAFSASTLIARLRTRDASPTAQTTYRKYRLPAALSFNSARKLDGLTTGR